MFQVVFNRSIMHGGGCGSGRQLCHLLNQKGSPEFEKRVIIIDYAIYCSFFASA
jgi:hypothetical protein